MTKKKKFRNTAIAASIAAVIATGGICYGADVGGIQRKVQLWLHGDQTDAVMYVNQDDGIGHYTVQDENGQTIQSGGGVSIDDDGTEHPLSESDFLEDLNGPSVETVNGRKYLYYKDQKIDLTDQFDTDGLYYITLKDGDKTYYVTVTRSGGLSLREDRYPQKDELPEEWFETESET